MFVVAAIFKQNNIFATCKTEYGRQAGDYWVGMPFVKEPSACGND